MDTTHGSDRSAGSFETQRPPWRAGDLFMTLGGGFAASVLILVSLGSVYVWLGRPLTIPAELALAGTALYGGFCVSGWAFAVRRRRATARQVGFVPVPAGAVLMMLPATLLVLMLNGVVVWIMSALVGDVPGAREQLVGDDTVHLTGGDLAWLLLLGAVAAPVAEEFLFRGLLYGYLRARTGVAVAAVASALLFAVMHLIVPLIPSLFIVGIVLAVVTERYKSLYPAIALHSFFNATQILLLFAVLG